VDIAAVPATTVSGTWWRHAPAGGDPLYSPARPASGRWQRGHVVEGVYLADSRDTAWAGFYRYLAEAGQPPDSALPRDLWQWRVALARVADLRDPATLNALALAALRPERRDWPGFQAAGEALWRAGWRALLATSAARPAGAVLCVFRAAGLPAGVEPLAPPERIDLAPIPPRGVTT
jgi:hypothetical protein